MYSSAAYCLFGKKNSGMDCPELPTGKMGGGGISLF